MRVEAAMEMGKGISAQGFQISVASTRQDWELRARSRKQEGYSGPEVALVTRILYHSPSSEVRTECYACDRGEDGLGGEIASAEIGGGEGQDFEGKALGFDHDETGECEADHGAPIAEGWVTVRRSFQSRSTLRGEVTSFRQTRPAVPPGDETDVENKKNRKQIVRYCNSYGCTGKPPVELLRMLDGVFLY